MGVSIPTSSQCQPTPEVGSADQRLVVRRMTARDVQRRAAEAIATAHSGQIDATIDYDDGTSLVLQVRFQFNDAGRPLRVHSVVVARNATGVTRAGESLLDGDRTWHRAPEGHWVLDEQDQARSPNRDIARTLRMLLPDVSAIPCPILVRTAGAVALRWHDASLNAELRLELDPTSSMPLRFRRETRSTGVVLEATFSAWNRPAVIIPPDQPQPG